MFSNFQALILEKCRTLSTHIKDILAKIEYNAKYNLHEETQCSRHFEEEIEIQRFIIYYINTSEIPSELSRENFISSHVKITCYLHM